MKSHDNINNNSNLEFYMNRMLDVQIKDVAPHIFRRPFLVVEPDTHMLQIATFLAIGPQIYVDGLVVMDTKGEGKPVGRIGSQHIIRNILDVRYPIWLQTNASQIMDSFVRPVEMNSPLSIALEVYKKTRFAFVPIIVKKEGKKEDSVVVTATLAIRDILPLIAKAKLSILVKEVSSRLISLDGKTSIRDAIEFMMNKAIRNIAIKEGDSTLDTHGESSRYSEGAVCIVNDRKLLEFLLSHNGREVMRKNGIAGLTKVDIADNLNVIFPTTVESETSVSKAAELLMDIRNPCLILEKQQEKGMYNSIVTPWDVVMKILKP